MKNKTLVLIALALVVLLGGAYALYQNLSQDVSAGQLAVPPSVPQESHVPDTAPDPMPNGLSVPDFTVYDRDGNPVRLSDYAGKPIILNFWSSKCGPCRREMPLFQEAFDKYQDQIQFVMVNVTDGSWDTLASAQKYLTEGGYTFPALFDTDEEASMAYRVRSLPSTFLVDKNGNLVGYHPGMMTEPMLQQAIEAVLK